MAENATPTIAAPDLAPDITDEELGFDPLPVDPGKPVETEAVPATDEKATAPESPEVPQAPETSPKQEPSRLLAGKYETQDQLVEGYRNSQAEATRLAQEKARLEGELRAYREPRETRETQERPQYTPDQLRDWRAEYQLQASTLPNEAREARARGEYEVADKLMRKANIAVRQIGACDDALRHLEYETRTTQSRRGEAEQRLFTRGRAAADKFKPVLVEGSPLYGQASEIHNELIASGRFAQDDPLAALVAVALAAQTGNSPAQLAQSTQSTPPKVEEKANRALRQVPLGAGAASGQTTKVVDCIADFGDDLDGDAKFMEWDRKHMGVNW